MTSTSPQKHSASEMTAANAVLFWGCFIALVTTAFGFIARMFLINTWAAEFGLDAPQSGRLAGIGIWPFAVSIIGFSLVIDKIGYKIAMLIAFVGHITWAIMGVSAYFLSHQGDKATAYQLLFWGSLVLALGNGTVEAFINPVVATLFHREKTKWLNILHAGWPGGLAVAGIITIFIDFVPWWIKVGLIAVPAVIYLIMLLPCHFPVQERAAAGVSYRDMLAEFGVLGAIIVSILVTLQLMNFFSDNDTRALTTIEKTVFIGIGAFIVLAFGAYTRSLGRVFLFFMILIMMPLATTEIGTDGWITAIMEDVAKSNHFHPGWVLVYTSVIMMVLRFFAGPIVHSLSPLGLLALSAALAIGGLYLLSSAVGLMIFAAATLYALGKTFFWPTMLGVVSEQTPKGGALTLNAISGIGMLAVGTLGFPFIGTLQSHKEIVAVANNAELKKEVPGLVDASGKPTFVVEKKIYEVLSYEAISNDKLEALVPSEKRAEVMERVKKIGDQSRQGALADMAMFPAFMLVCYLILIVYFAMRGGYKPVDILPGVEDVPSEDAPFPPLSSDQIQKAKDKFGTLNRSSEA
jgi:MFS family permease